MLFVRPSPKYSTKIWLIKSKLYMPVRLLESAHAKVFLKYITSALISYGLVNTLFITFIELLHLTHRLSFFLALLISLFINNIILKFFVFSSKKNWMLTASKLLLVSLCFRSIEFAQFHFLFSFGLHYLLCSTLAMGTSSLIKFFVLKKFVY